MILIYLRLINNHTTDKNVKILISSQVFFFGGDSESLIHITFNNIHIYMLNYLCSALLH